MSKKKVYLLGSGGHANAVLDLLEESQISIAGIISNETLDFFEGVPVIGDDSVGLKLNPDETELILGIGSVDDKGIRREVFQKYKDKGFSFKSIIHKSAYVSSSAILGEGSQVLAGVIIGPKVIIEENVLLNNRVLVEHHCHVGAHCHVGPGAVVCGGVRVGSDAFLGAGSTVIQGVEIGVAALVAAGATVIENVLSGTRVKGVPAK